MSDLAVSRRRRPPTTSLGDHVNRQNADTASTTPASLEDLQLEIVRLLSTLLEVFPTVAALADSHQRGIGFLSYIGRQTQNDMVRKERRDQIKGVILGQPAGHGATAAPGNIAALDAYAQIGFTAQHQVWRLTRWLARNGIKTTLDTVDDEVPVDGPSVIVHLRVLRPLVWEVTQEAVLTDVLRDLQHAYEVAERLVDGPRNVYYPDVDCPHCGRPTLRLTYVRAVLESVSCEDDQTTGERHPCVCPDPLCACKTRPIAHHHTWHRQRLNKIDGLLTLTGLLKRQKTANEKEPTS